MAAQTSTTFVPVLMWHNSTEWAIPYHCTLPWNAHKSVAKSVAKTMDAGSTYHLISYVRNLIDNKGRHYASLVCYDLLLRFMEPNPRFAPKFTAIHQLFASDWKVTIMQVIELADRICRSKCTTSDKKLQIRAIKSVFPKSIRLDPFYVFADKIPYQILIEERGLIITGVYAEKYAEKYPERSDIIAYFNSIVPLSERKKSVVVPALSLDESIRALPLELIDIIAGYVTGY